MSRPPFNQDCLTRVQESFAKQHAMTLIQATLPVVEPGRLAVQGDHEEGQVGGDRSAELHGAIPSGARRSATPGPRGG